MSGRPVGWTRGCCGGGTEGAPMTRSSDQEASQNPHRPGVASRMSIPAISGMLECVNYVSVAGSSGPDNWYSRLHCPRAHVSHGAFDEAAQPLMLVPDGLVMWTHAWSAGEVEELLPHQWMVCAGIKSSHCLPVLASLYARITHWVRQ